MSLFFKTDLFAKQSNGIDNSKSKHEGRDDTKNKIFGYLLDHALTTEPIWVKLRMSKVTSISITGYFYPE